MSSADISAKNPIFKLFLSASRLALFTAFVPRYALPKAAGEKTSDNIVPDKEMNSSLFFLISSSGLSVSAELFELVILSALDAIKLLLESILYWLYYTTKG